MSGHSEILEQNKYALIEKQGPVAIVWFDLEGEKVNKIGPDLIDAFEALLSGLDNRNDIEAVVLASRKKDFIAGADIESMQRVEKPGDFQPITKKGHELLNKIERSKKPFVAAMNGVSLGGGLEVALACAGRVAADSRSTVFGLPEVKLGLLPSGGGTQRLPRLIGIRKALDMMLTGKNIYLPQALKMGLVDRKAPQESLVKAAAEFALELRKKPINRKPKRTFQDWLLEGNPIGQNILFNKSREMVQRMTAGNYPAPFRIIDCVQTGIQKGLAAGFQAEVEKYEELILTPQSRQLINLFFAMTAKKKNPMKEEARPVKTLAMLGAGFMGAGIAEVSVLKDIDVILKDIKQETISSAKATVWKSLEKKIRYKALTQPEGDQIMGRITGTLDYSGFEKADIVIEAVFEDLNLKKKIIAECEAATGEDCIFASNTSALPITAIAEGAKRPHLIIGMHYFSPVPKMPLLEIIVTPHTASWVTATCLELGIRQGKTCIVVNDGPGFYTTRILAPLFNETLLLLEEGADILQIDKAIKKFGFPVGPVTLLDEVGIDVGAHVMSGDLTKYFKMREGALYSEALPKMFKDGYSGRKNKKGFYQYDPKTGKKLRNKVNADVYNYFGGANRKSFTDEYIQQRCAFAMINEAAYCLQEGILHNPTDGDVGAIFGLGFPPFLGGPFRYIDTLGAAKVTAILDDLAQKAGARFKRAQILADYAQAGKKFYP